MAKKAEANVTGGTPVIIGDDGGPECIIPHEKLEKTREILCKAWESLTITNGNELLFHDKEVESVTIKFRGD